MAFKQEITKTEARIILRLKDCDHQYKYVASLTSWLDSYTGHISTRLKAMETKGWLRSEMIQNRRYYDLTDKTPYHKAVEVHQNG